MFKDVLIFLLIEVDCIQLTKLLFLEQFTKRVSCPLVVAKESDTWIARCETWLSRESDLSATARGNRITKSLAGKPR